MILTFNLVHLFSTRYSRLTSIAIHGDRDSTAECLGSWWAPHCYSLRPVDILLISLGSGLDFILLFRNTTSGSGWLYERRLYAIASILKCCCLRNDATAYSPGRYATTSARPRNLPTNSHFAPDTLDLQDHEAPSAKDHGGLHPVVNSGTTLAPHQEATIRHMEDEQRAQQDLGPDTWVESGRSSHEGSELLDEDSEFYQNSAMDSRGSPANHDGKDEDDDMEGDDDGDDNGDDDMLDKISSSPSIDDGMPHRKPRNTELTLYRGY